MKMFTVNIVLGLAWLFLTGEFSAKNFWFGFIICYCVLWLSFRNSDHQSYFRKGPAVILLLFITVKAILLSSFDVARDVLRTGKKVKPAFIHFPAAVSSDLELIILSNLICLTPGTLVIDFNEEKQEMFIHILNARQEAQTRKTMENLSRRVKDLFK